MKKFFVFLIAALVLLSPVCAHAAQLPGDGEYTASAALSGGSGKASVESPMKITVSGGKAEATVVWSSPYYTYMLVDGVKYEPVQDEGNSTFIVPVTLDEDIAFSAETIAMSEPHVIDYTLRIDSSTLTPASGGNSQSAYIVIAVLAVLAVFSYVTIEHRKRSIKK